jgi:hypothetical protein
VQEGSKWLCRSSLWTRFDLVAMAWAVCVMLLACVVAACLACDRGVLVLDGPYASRERDAAAVLRAPDDAAVAHSGATFGGLARAHPSGVVAEALVCVVVRVRRLRAHGGLAVLRGVLLGVAISAGLSSIWYVLLCAPRVVVQGVPELAARA